jgi:hypothetical protein
MYLRNNYYKSIILITSLLFAEVQVTTRPERGTWDPDGSHYEDCNSI